LVRLWHFSNVPERSEDVRQLSKADLATARALSPKMNPKPTSGPGARRKIGRMRYATAMISSSLAGLDVHAKYVSPTFGPWKRHFR
jgi:hypothetical protein